MIEVRNLSVAYPDGTKAVSGVSFTVGDGESVAVVGANGAGKSTLLCALVGILPASGGTICVNGMAVQKKHLPQIRAAVGLVFQNPDDQLFMPSIYDDIAFGPRNYGLSEAEAEKRVSEVLAALDAGHLKDKAPHKLSGGEKRIAALGSVLAMRPSVMLLDEPSSFLDPRARRGIIALLAGIGLTKLVATHDLDLALALCDRVLVLRKGGLFADGRASDILQNVHLMAQAGLELPLCCQASKRA